MKRVRFIGLLLIILLTVLIGGCGVKERQKNIYEQNSEISQAGDSYSYSQRLGEVDEQSLNIAYERFYGTDTIWLLNAEQTGKITINYDLALASGDFKVVLVTPQDEVTVVAEGSGKGEYETQVSPGKYRVKIVGRNAFGEAAAEIKSADGVQVSVP